MVFSILCMKCVRLCLVKWLLSSRCVSLCIRFYVVVVVDFVFLFRLVNECLSVL